MSSSNNSSNGLNAFVFAISVFRLLLNFHNIKAFTLLLWKPQCENVNFIDFKPNLQHKVKDFAVDQGQMLFK